MPPNRRLIHHELPIPIVLCPPLPAAVTSKRHTAVDEACYSIIRQAHHHSPHRRAALLLLFHAYLAYAHAVSGRWNSTEWTIRGGDLLVLLSLSFFVPAVMVWRLSFTFPASHLMLPPPDTY